MKFLKFIFLIFPLICFAKTEHDFVNLSILDLSRGKYIVDKGINENRIVAKGYGEKEPKESNKSSEGRAINRRTEVRTVIKNK